MWQKRWAAGFFLASMLGCGQNLATDQGHEQTSELRYLVNTSTPNLTKNVKNKTIRICLSGAPDDTLLTWQNNITKAVLLWVEPLREMSADQLADRVDFVLSGDKSCDMELYLKEGQYAMVSFFDRPIMKLSTHDNFNVLLHEMGHAFGLKDTYSSFSSGVCLEGQPKSLMCDTSFSELQNDDREGVREMFRRIFPNEKPASP